MSFLTVCKHNQFYRALIAMDKIIPQFLFEQELPAASLYVVASPIGNLGDITLRALHVLNQVDGIACEDTRHSAQLLNHYDIRKPLMAIHEHNEMEAANTLIEHLHKGERWAYLADAGTPGISDPGARLVMQVGRHGFRAIPIPGASALTSALSVCGSTLLASTGQFQFLGFLPNHAKEFDRVLEQMVQSTLPSVFYESPHRLSKTFLKLSKALPGDRDIFVARELSKKFESISHLKPNELIPWLENPNNQKGEFVIILSGSNYKRVDPERAASTKLAGLLKDHMGSRDIAAVLSSLFGLNKNEAYEIALSFKEKG